MPARHKSLQDDLLLKSKFQTGGSGRRKRVSARHQVKRLDRPFGRVRSFENRSGRRNEFSSFGADLQGPQFHRRSLAQVKSGPDVFADALVHRGRLGSLAGAAAPGDLFPKSSITVISDHPGFTARRVQGVLRSRCSDGYRFAKWQGKPNSARRRKPPRNKHSHHLRRVACGIRLRRIHRNT